eukprot:1322784-Rhodomonas_salina.2
MQKHSCQNPVFDRRRELGRVGVGVYVGLGGVHFAEMPAPGHPPRTSASSRRRAVRSVEVLGWKRRAFAAGVRGLGAGVTQHIGIDRHCADARANTLGRQPTHKQPTQTSNRHTHTRIAQKSEGFPTALKERTHMKSCSPTRRCAPSRMASTS